MQRLECHSSPFEGALATYNCDLSVSLGGVNGVHEDTGDNGFALIGNDDRNVFVDSFSGRAEESLLMGDYVNAKGGDDYIYISSIPAKGNGSTTISGGLGSDIVDLPGLPDSFARDDNFTVLTWSNREGSLQAHIGDDVEFAAILEAPDRYLLSDLMEGSITPLTHKQIKKVAIDQFIPAKGTEDNWFLDEGDAIDGSSDQGDAIDGSSDQEDEVIGSKSSIFVVSPPQIFKKKKAQKIKGFNPGRGDVLSFNSDELFNSGEGDFAFSNNKRELRRASRKGVDFVFYEPKNILFYDANGAAKGFGSQNEGGVIARFIAPEGLNSFNLTSDNINLF